MNLQERADFYLRMMKEKHLLSHDTKKGIKLRNKAKKDFDMYFDDLKDLIRIRIPKSEE